VTLPRLHPDELPSTKTTDPRIHAYRRFLQERWFEFTGYCDQGPPHDAQRAFHEDGHRFRCVVKGRRGGGTTAIAREIEAEAMIWDGPVTSGDIAIFAPTAPLTDRAFGMVWDSLVTSGRIPRHWIAKPKKVTPVPPGDRQLFFVWGARIFAYSLDAEMPGEGLGLRLAVVDEAGHKNFNTNTWNSSIFPTLLDRAGRAIICGAAKQAGRYFRDLRALQHTDPDWSTHAFPSMSNPSVGTQEVETARRTMPDWLFRQEILAEDVDMGDTPWTEEQVLAIVDDRLPVHRPRHPAGAYVDGWDLAKDVDWTVGITLEASGICCRCEGQGTVLRGGSRVPCDHPTCEAGKVPFELYAFERFQKRPWPLVERAMGERCKEYQSTVIFDATGVGKVTSDYLEIPSGRLWRKSKTAPDPGFVFSTASKLKLLMNLQVMIQKRLIRIPVIPQLIEELRTYEWDDAALTQDCVMALALACWATAGRPSLKISWV
jgi:hypothetical protein